MTYDTGEKIQKVTFFLFKIPLINDKNLSKKRSINFHKAKHYPSKYMQLFKKI